MVFRRASPPLIIRVREGDGGSGSKHTSGENFFHECVLPSSLPAARHLVSLDPGSLVGWARPESA